MYAWYVWTGRDFLKAGSNNQNSNFVFKIIATNLRGENGVLEENKYFIQNTTLDTINEIKRCLMKYSV